MPVPGQAENIFRFVGMHTIQDINCGVQYRESNYLPLDQFQNFRGSFNLAQARAFTTILLLYRTWKQLD
jgi:hypothetical protein